MASRSGTAWRAFVGVLLVALAIAFGLWVRRGLDWLLVMVAMLVFFLFLGQWICGRPLGILVNERNLMSLSRFQMVLWTLLVLGAYWTIALKRVTEGHADPLGIQLDWRLWALMGISTASLVGSPLILATKTRKQPADSKKVIEATARAFSETDEEVEKNREGTLYGNPDISDARFTDMFEGEELKNTAYVDLAKVQMFFFTLVAALSYGVVLYKTILTKEPPAIDSLPKLPEGLLALLGISHAGYLGSKAVDHTSVAP